MVILKVEELRLAELDPLIRESEAEGFLFLRRLQTEWEEGTNRFNQEHEGIYTLRDAGALVAIGGINQDPFSADHRTARLRRFYVKQSERRKGLGRKMVMHILTVASGHFDFVTLRTDTRIGSRFYEALGFVRVYGVPETTHRRCLNNHPMI